MKANFLDASILILDDDEDDFMITSDYLKSISGNSFQIYWCSKYEEGLECVKGSSYDLFMVDYRLGAKTGIDFLKEAKKFDTGLPIVLLTGKGNYNIDLQSMEHGAIDYLVKTELTTEKIERTVRYAIGRAMTLKALKENEAKYRTIFEKSKDIVFVTDCNLNFVDVNPAITELLGFTKETVIGKNIGILVDKEHWYKINALLHANNNGINDIEVLVDTQKGEKINCTISLSPETPGNPKSNMHGIIHDVTSLKMVEKINVQTEKLAASSRLLRIIAHEVRNPLNNITLSAEQLLEETRESETLMYLDIIQRNSTRINNLITELLQTSNPVTNAQEIVPLQEILDAVLATSTDRLKLKGIGLSKSYPKNPIYVLADIANLKIAFLNIVTNAIESMVDGIGKLNITISADNTTTNINISDNGHGISKENLERLFEPYFTRKRNGLGLGLTFTLNIFKAHNAIIDVTSEEQVGSVFKIVMPRVP